MKKVTKRDVSDALCVDQVALKHGVFTVRRGFFYTHDKTAQDLVASVEEAFADAVVVDSGEVWKAFRGGASVRDQSHWFVKFTL